MYISSHTKLQTWAQGRPYSLLVEEDLLLVQEEDLLLMGE